MEMLWVFVCLCSLLMLPASSAYQLQGNINVSPAVRANQTLRGLFEYYWYHDSRAKHIKFFFACGQIGSDGTGVWNSCTCNNRASCVNCYRWWDAVAMEAVATYGIYTNTKPIKEYADMATSVFAHSPYNSNWNASGDGCTFVDDFSWYGIAYLRIYEWTKNPVWLNHSVALYNWAWEYGWDDDHDCGGFWWNTCGDQKFKDSITIVEIMHLGAKLSYLFPKNTSFLTSAQKIWDWFFSFDNGHGLMSDTYLVSTGAVPELCCNSTSKSPLVQCHNAKTPGTAYNQGLLMSAAAFLYVRTANETYLKVGMRALEAIFENYTTEEGILVDERRGFQTYSYSCVNGGDPGGDYYSFNGIFMAHLGYFTDLLVKHKSMPAETLTRIKNFVQKTSDSAWKKSAVWPPFKEDDKCNIGLGNANVTFPKFYWWWGQNVTKQKVFPSDIRQWYKKHQLRCVTINGNDTQIWEGNVSSEDVCRQNCSKFQNCSKYLYQTYQSEVAGLNCWIWSYNRSNHVCNQTDYDWDVGIKRPIMGSATCAGHCNSKEPLKTENGQCYCDADCTNHLDCCLDYADHCIAGNNPPSCKGMCNSAVPKAQAITGGGYCWCDYGCNKWGTDNNSDSSCCPDYMEVCMKVPPPVCFDARSQGSALNLFNTHIKMMQIK